MIDLAADADDLGFSGPKIRGDVLVVHSSLSAGHQQGNVLADDFSGA